MKLLRAMGAEELAKFLTGEPLINRTKHTSKTDSVGFCFAPGDDIYDVMQHMAGVVNDQIILVGTLKAKPKHTFKKGYGMYASHKEIPTDNMGIMIQTLDMLKELTDKEHNCVLYR